MVTNETAQIIAGGIAFSRDHIFSRFMELLTAPYNYTELLWMAIPLFIVLIFMDLYFGRYKGEELGWNTAVGNSLVLIFVSIDMVRYLFNNLVNPSFINLFVTNLKELFIIFILALSGIWLLIANFFHILPKRFTFLISSSTATIISAYIAIVVVYTKIPLDFVTLFAAILFTVLLVLILKIIQFLVPIYIKE